MMTIQALRRSRGITLIDLALLSGIPARTIAQIEHGLQQLDSRTREQLAHVFGVPPTSLAPGVPSALQQQVRRRLIAEARLAAPMVGLAIATAALLAPSMRPAEQAASQTELRPALSQSSAATGVSAAVSIPYSFGLVNDATGVALAGVRDGVVPKTVQPHGQPQLDGGPKAVPGNLPAQTGDGTPSGCPLATTGRVVVTQGYGIGTHAPADVWGALDLAVDSDGDGEAEIAATRGVFIFTQHAGSARVVMNSWPAGHYVRVTNGQAGWATAYAHLDQVFVRDGQWLEVGTVIGTVGETGMTTGAHLHYEVWQGGVNVDPTPYLRCG